jgi:hypothetical protein
MFKIELNPYPNTISIEISGCFDLNQAEQIHKRLEAVLPDFKQGFILITDISSLQDIDNDVRISIKKSMDLINRHRPSRIIRIVPDINKDVGFNIMSMFHYSKDIKINTLQSPDQSEVLRELGCLRKKHQ